MTIVAIRPGLDAERRQERARLRMELDALAGIRAAYFAPVGGAVDGFGLPETPAGCLLPADVQRVLVEAVNAAMRERVDALRPIEASLLKEGG